MAYTQNIPQPSDLISQSQPLILQNFQSIGTVYPTDHVDFNASGAGYHLKTTFPASTAPTNPTGTVMLYSKVDGASVPQLFLRKQNSGTEIQMSTIDPVIANPGRTFMAGGIIMQWATASLTTGAVTFAGIGLTAFPTSCFAVLLTSANGAAGAVGTTGSFTNTGFSCFVSVGAHLVTVLAIGN